MTLTLMYILTILLTILLLIVVKDKEKGFKLTGIITISSSFLLLLIPRITKTIIDKKITAINMSPITNYISKEFEFTSIILLTLGIVEILVSVYISKRKAIIKE